MSRYLEFSLGPVQSFVAQARRTRDLWGGSWLLSYLAAVALNKAQQLGGVIVHPVVTSDPMFSWVAGRRTSAAPSVGSLPNHFAVEFNDPNGPREAAEQIVKEVEEEWKRIADAVWNRFFNHTEQHGNGTRDIWDRQIGDTWDHRWVATASPNGVDLARRKLWGTRMPTGEPGDKCSVIHDRQELSGYVRARGEAASQDRFWKEVRSKTGPYDLREGERLSAPAAVKRLFARLDKAALGWQPPDVHHWPSTHHLAARAWLKAIADDEPSGIRNQADNEAKALIDDSEAEGVRAAVPGVTGIDNVRGLDPTRYGDLHARLPEDQRPADPPSRFYAVLVADGDRIGELVRQNMEAASQALAEFARKVPGIVEDHGGVTVYAGGDDLLALLPFDEALQCARKLRDTFGGVFESQQVNASLSAAVVFAHAKVPLTEVIDHARRLLEDVAKEENRRDSLAVGLLRPGGLHARWVASWDSNPEERVGDVVADLQSSTDLSTSGLHRVKDVLALSCGWPRWQPGSWSEQMLDPVPLIVGELTSAQIPSGLDLEKLSKRLVALSRRSRTSFSRETQLGLDGIEVARFLGGGWKEEG